MSSYVPTIAQQYITCGTFPSLTASEIRRRFSLFVSLGDLWSHGVILAGRMKKILDRSECPLQIFDVDARHPEHGWYISDKKPGGQIKIKDLYLQSDPNFKGRAILPVLWDNEKRKIVSNDSVEITKIILHEFDELLVPSDREKNKGEAAFSHVPAELRGHIDELYQRIYCVCYGLYNVQFAEKEDDKDQAAAMVLQSLDFIEDWMRKNRENNHYAYLCGNRITTPDILLYGAIVRFDVVLRLLHRDFPEIRNNPHYEYIHDWLLRLYHGCDPEAKWIFQETTKFDKIKSEHAELMPKDNKGRPIYGSIPDILGQERIGVAPP